MLSKLIKHVAVGCVLVMVMLLSRICYTGNLTYAFIAWNMFLAFVPLLVATIARRYSFHSWKLLIASAVWLLFFPNAPYLITDLYHLSHLKGVPLWYDALMLYLAAYTCVMMGFVSLRMLEIQWNDWLKKWHLPQGIWSRIITRSSVVILLFVATGFGIYLGRELRYNTWDIITDTQSLATDIVIRVLSPIRYIKAWGFTAVYAVCLYFFYHAISFSRNQDLA